MPRKKTAASPKELPITAKLDKLAEQICDAVLKEGEDAIPIGDKLAAFSKLTAYYAARMKLPGSDGAGEKGGFGGTLDALKNSGGGGQHPRKANGTTATIDF